MNSSISSAAAAMGRLGGRSKSRAKRAAARQNIKRASATLTPEQRIERAKKAAAARWNKAEP